MAWRNAATALAATTAALLLTGQGQASAQEISGLQCRLASGPWQQCRMEVERVGSRWWLVVGDQRIEFRHDGHGSVQMQRYGSGWQPVTARWQEDTSLCWDGVCARGDLPLD